MNAAYSVDYIVQFAWGMVVLAAFIGWGRVAHRLAGRPGGAALDWGLAAGWGMALALIAGGLLSVMGLVSVLSVSAFVVIGAAAAVALQANWAVPRPRGMLLLTLVAVIAVLAIRYASVVSYEALSCSDDNIAYFAFVSKMLQTGTLIEPFSLRRLAGYGGQTFLQSLNVAAGSEDNAYLMDRGIAVIVAVGLAIGFFQRRGRVDAAIGLMVLLLVVLLPFPLLNSASHATGLALFLTLFRTLELTDDPALAGRRYLWLIGAVIAAAASLRAHYLAAAAVAVSVFWVHYILEDRRRAGAGIKSWAACGMAALVFLAPWMILLIRSSGTPLYPLIRGNQRSDLETFSAPLPLPEQVQFFAGIVADPGVALFTVPVVLYLISRESRAGLALYGGALATTAMVAWIFTNSDATNIHRYVAPFLNAAFIATVLVFVQRARTGLDPGSRAKRLGDAILCVAALGLAPVMVAKDVGRLADKWGRTVLTADGRAAYQRMQQSVPAGAGILVIVSHPFALDYRRNNIVGIDIPGAVSPDPGMPFFKGPNVLRAYLRDQGIGFVAYRTFTAPGGCLYDRRLWDFNRGQTAYREGRLLAPYYLDIMDNIDALALTEDVVFSASGLNVLRL